MPSRLGPSGLSTAGASPARRKLEQPLRYRDIMMVSICHDASGSTVGSDSVGDDSTRRVSSGSNHDDDRWHAAGGSLPVASRS